MKSIFCISLLSGLLAALCFYKTGSLKKSLLLLAACLAFEALNLWLVPADFTVRIFYMELYLLFLAFEDCLTLHVSYWWILASIPFFFFGISYIHIPANSRVLAALIFALPAFIMAFCLDWMGSADPWFLLMFGFILGLERMIVCMLITLGLAFAAASASQKRKLPFLTFLASGFLVSLLRGWAIYVTIVA